MINHFKYPAADTIRGRTSTICRSMACTLVTREPCTPELEETWSSFFDNKCAYCGAEATHLDHLYPLIKDKEPTGYGTGPSNLVPCCPKCNQAKGNVNWKEFINSDKCSHIDGNKDARISKINEFQNVMPATKNIIDDNTKKSFHEIRDQFTKALQEAENKLLTLREALKQGKN